MNLNQPTVLGRTGLKAGRLGVASSYGAPAEAFEEAFDRGCNYFYWGSLRKRGMAEAIRNICGRGRRNDLIIVIQVINLLRAEQVIFRWAQPHSKLTNRYG